jgi:ribosomal protein L7Ae-like RNA K-turn-binding protein
MEQLLKESNKVIGLRQVLRGVKKGEINRILLALDADEAIKNQINQIAVDNNLPLLTCQSKDELGKEVNIDRACAVIGFLK